MFPFLGTRKVKFKLLIVPGSLTFTSSVRTPNGIVRGSEITSKEQLQPNHTYTGSTEPETDPYVDSRVHQLSVRTGIY